MAPGSRPTIDLRAGSLAAADLIVSRLEGVEALSAPFQLEVEFARLDGEAVDLGGLLDAEALVTLRRPDGPQRVVHGVVQAAELAGPRSSGPVFRLRMTPTAARLRHVRRSRVFQGLSAEAIVEQLLRAVPGGSRSSLGGTYPARDLCVQYRESDLDFAARLLEEEGIFYRFEHSPGADVLVLGDDRNGFAPLPDGDSLPYRPAGGLEPSEEHVSALEWRRGVAVGAVLLRDHDFERPSVDLSADDRAEGGGAEREEYPGGYGDVAQGKRLARVHLEEHRFGGSHCAGRSSSIRLAPGLVFELAGAPPGAPADRLVVVRVRHTASQEEPGEPGGDRGLAYRNEFVAIPASLPYRARRITPRPRVAGAHTARVVGPASEEIHTDRHGRIRVQFPWDRDARGDERSSCWIRVAQAWAGPGQGAVFLPRVGQEVLVRFLEGDPDRPIVLGALHNASAPPPASLPQEKTQTSLRSASSPGSAGANELRLEDAAGAERLQLHAQRDERIEVERHKGQRIAGSERLQVGGDRAVTVDGHHALAVLGDEASRVAGAQDLSVDGERAVSVGGDHEEEVAGDRKTSVAGSLATATEGASVESVEGASTSEVGTRLEVAVRRELELQIGGGHELQVAGDRTLGVGGAVEESVGRDADEQVQGDSAADVAEAVDQAAKRDVRLEAAAAVGMEAAGAVEARGRKLRIEADELAVLVGGKRALSIDRSGTVTLSGASFEIDGSQVVLKGSKVQLDASEAAKQADAKVRRLKELKEARALVEFTLVDQDGKPMAGEPYRAEFPDGSVKKGVTGAEGKATVPGAREGKVQVSFPRIDDEGKA